jgi:SNF2 family DNA or RNA helicase
VQERGRQVFDDGRLETLAVAHDGYASIAHGTSEYEVSLMGETLYCECPYFADNGYCKHSYALLLAIDEWSRTGSAPAAAPSVRVSKRRANWQEVIETAAREEDLESSDSSPLGEHLVYRSQAPAGAISHTLELELFVQERKKNGSLTTPKQARLRRGDVDRLPNAEDRAILAELWMVAPENSAWSGYYLYDQPKGSVYLTGPRLPDIVRRLCATERLFLGSSHDKNHWRLARWSDRKLALRVRTTPVSEQDWIEALVELHDGSTVVSVKGVHFIDSRLVLFDDTFLELESHPAPAWVRQAVHGFPIHVPRQDWPQFFGLVTSLRRGPSWNLPDELSPRAVRGTPRTRIVFKFDARRSVAAGEMSFLYRDGEAILETFDRDIHFAMSQDASVVIYFDEAFHQQARLLLRQSGFQPVKDPETFKRTWETGMTRFGKAVRPLIENGWDVLAEGKPVRVSTGAKVKVSSGIDWFALDARAEFDDQEASLPELLEALGNKSTFVRLGDGSIGILPEAWIQRYAPLARFGKEVDGKIQMRLPQAPLLDALLDEKDFESTDEIFERVRGKLRGFSGIVAAPQPAGFIGTMRPYQREGLAWLLFLEELELGGCLADDMGVGKTIQMLALLELHRERRAGGENLAPDLVVVPKSLIFNWMAEAGRFAPGLRVLDYTGMERDDDAIAHHDVVLTTYGILRRDITHLKDVPFHTVVLDESQAIKNAGSDSAKAARLVTARHRMAMTGTPIENHLGELWSLFEFLNPGLLGSASAWRAGSQMDVEARNWLRKALRPLILRRTKQQVASELPPRTEQVLVCEMELEQRRMYSAILNRVRQDLDRRIRQDGLAKSKMHVLEALLRLRQVACHPKLVQETSAAPSAKFELLLDQLAEVVEEGHKALVFSQFTSLLALLKPHLEEARLPFEYLDGSTTDRQQRVERFQSDPKCPLFLLSLKAGGTGLNLTAADYVFLLDPWWNPAVEAQAIDRTHRIGQTRPVFAYRIVAKDTIEERILSLQQQKRDLAKAILGEDNSMLGSLRREDLDYLLS